MFRFPDCDPGSSTDWASWLTCLTMAVLCLVILGGNLATMITIGSERRKSSYQYLQMSLCCADIILAMSGPLVSALVTLMFLTGHLEPGNFLTGNLFHRFQYAEEAVSVGFDNVIKTEMPLLVMSGVGVSLSTTVSILTIACMALLRSGYH